MKQPRAILFDWDNTLVDTWPVIHDAINTTLETMGHGRWTMEETRVRVARSLRDTFPALFGEKWEAARDIFYSRFGDIHLEALTLMPGARALLESLAEDGLYLGVVSNKMGAHLRREAAHLDIDGFFGQLVGATDASEDKPSPAPVHLALEGAPVGAGPDVWFVGDSPVDMQCAANAGCCGILLRETPPEPGEFENYDPKMHFSGCSALSALVARR